MPLTATSLKRLENVEPALVDIIKEAISRTMLNVQISEGARSLAQQKKNLAKGVSQTLKSKHLDPDGSGPKKARAVDIAIITADGKYDTALKNYCTFHSLCDMIKQIEKGGTVLCNNANCQD